jgi:3-oxoacyl-[acyl-carrier-protein] synthase-3
MAKRIIHHSRILGVSAVVPADIYYIKDYEWMEEEPKNKFIQKVGIEQKRHAAEGVTAGDLCEAAANKLLDELRINRSEIDVLVFVSQTRDHIFPCTSTILQHKLGLSTSCMALDIPLGCSGYCYGISVLASLMESGSMRKGLLLAGDTCSKVVSYKDYTFFPLLGDAGTATLFEYDSHATPIYTALHTDGSGAEHLIMPGGGFRYNWDSDVVEEKPRKDGISRKGYQAFINGPKIFEFSMREVVRNIQDTLEYAGTPAASVDTFFLHQANMMINESIRKLLKANPDKCPNSMRYFGNTGAATIPLTMVHALSGSVPVQKKIVMSGFGVGLSWGTVYKDAEPFYVSDISVYEV